MSLSSNWRFLMSSRYTLVGEHAPYASSIMATSGYTQPFLQPNVLIGHPLFSMYKKFFD